MGEQTHISWADHTFNPWEGCTKVSVGPRGACEGCYAEHLVQNRFGRATWGNHPRRRTSASNWRKPPAWNAEAEKAGTRPFVFCASLADVFDNQVDPEWRRDLFDLIRSTPALVWLLLTKRPQNIVTLFCQATDQLHDRYGIVPVRDWPSNAAIGCTVVTQEEADRDVPVLLAAKAALDPAFAFVSMEPLMGPVDLTGVQRPEGFLGNALATMYGVGLDWVITGGETDQGAHKARPSHPDWFRSLRDQCVAAGLPFHFKQWGEWRTSPEIIEARGSLFHQFDDGSWVQRLGKKVTGRELDGVIHDDRPVIA